MFSLFGAIWANRYGRATVKACFYVISLAVIFLAAQVIISVAFG